jgi:N-acetylmuramoyl-L-alanine amidase CwlA
MPKYINPILIDRDDNEKRHYTSAIPDAYDSSDTDFKYVARMGDRWDSIAYRFLGSPKYWYIIARANGGANGSIFIQPGQQIIIPQQL